jgi:hypothetical protein
MEGSYPPYLEAKGFRFQVSGVRIGNPGVSADARVWRLRLCGRADRECGGEKGYVASGQASTDKKAAAKGAGSEAARDSSAEDGISTGAIGNMEQYRQSCRMQTYTVKEGMSKAEVKDFNARVTYRVQANLNGGGDKNLGELLDDIDVPTYRGLCD